MLSGKRTKNRMKGGSGSESRGFASRGSESRGSAPTESTSTESTSTRIRSGVQVPESTSTGSHLPMFHTPNLIFFSLISPYVLLGFFLLLSLFNTNIKGIVFLIGVIIMIFFSSFVSKNMRGHESSVCNVFGGIGFLGKALPLSLLVYGFTFMYLLFPMVQNRMMNYPVLFSLLLLISSDISIKLKLECVNMKGIFVALSIATVSGIAWYILIQNIAPYLLYHVDYISDKQVCSMPSQQHFKCNVYKNGELISTMTE